MGINCLYCSVLLQKWRNTPRSAQKYCPGFYFPATSLDFKWTELRFVLLSWFKTHPNIFNFNCSSPPKNSSCISAPLVMYLELENARIRGEIPDKPWYLWQGWSSKGLLEPRHCKHKQQDSIAFNLSMSLI